MLREEPYSQKEAEAAIGLRTDNGKRVGKEKEMVEDDEMQTDSAQHPVESAV